MCEYKEIKYNFLFFIILDDKKCNNTIYNKMENHLCEKHTNEIINYINNDKITDNILLKYNFDHIISLYNYKYRYYDTC